MKRKLRRPTGGKGNKLKVLMQKAYLDICSHLLLPNAPFNKIPSVALFGRKLGIQAIDAAVLVLILYDRGKIERAKLVELTRNFRSKDELEESLDRLRGMLYIRPNSHIKHGTMVQLYMEFRQAFESGDLNRVLRLRPSGSNGLLSYAARIAHMGPYEQDEWEIFLDRLFEGQDQEHVFLKYMDDLEYFETLHGTLLLMVAKNHYYFDTATSIRDLKEVVRYSDGDLRELSVEILRSEWKPISEGLVEVHEGAFLFSAPGLKLTELGIQTWFPDLDFGVSEGELGLASPFHPYKGDLKNLSFPDSLRHQLSPIEQLLVPGVYEQYVAQSSAHHKGLLVLLHGKPGTGKTAWCENMLAATKRPMLAIQASKVISKWVGESSTQIRKIFDKYHAHVRQHQTYPIILLNEADQILGKRIEISSSADTEYNAITASILEELEGILMRGGIVLATTNTMSHLDEAFYRRFTDRIEFNGLTSIEQIALWQNAFPELSKGAAEYLFEHLGAMEPGWIQNIIAQYHRHVFLNGPAASTLSLLLEFGIQFQAHKAA
jgi:hypothetical protein